MTTESNLPEPVREMNDLERIIAEHADVSTDARGRKSYEFDDHGLRAFLAALAGAAPVAEVGRDLLGNPAIVSVYWDRVKYGDKLFTHAPAKAREVTEAEYSRMIERAWVVWHSIPPNVSNDDRFRRCIRAALATFTEGAE